MNIEQAYHEMAPPAGVEPTTYRLGGGHQHQGLGVDFIGNATSDWSIQLENSTSDFRSNTQVPTAILDSRAVSQ